MNKNEIILSQVQAPEEAEVIESEKVKLNSTWVMWENYEDPTGAKLEYNQSLKKLYEISDIISFWQFWRYYPGSTPFNIFYNGERLI
jgi:hypothetical protein